MTNIGKRVSKLEGNIQRIEADDQVRIIIFGAPNTEHITGIRWCYNNEDYKVTGDREEASAKLEQWYKEHGLDTVILASEVYVEEERASKIA